MAAREIIASGEVSERQELLDGRCVVELDGGAGELAITCSLSWRLGRDGDVPVEEGALTIEGERGEVSAVLAGAPPERGVVRTNADTGTTFVRAGFEVEAAEGGVAAPGDAIECELEIGVDEWRGRVVVVRSGS
jgi:hypothetical protein